MLKTALFDCAINEKYCSDDGGWGICPLFSSPPRGIWQLKSPNPQEFAIKGKNNANTQYCRTTIKSFIGTYNYDEVKPHPILNEAVTPGIIRFETRLSLFTETLIVVAL